MGTNESVTMKVLLIALATVFSTAHCAITQSTQSTLDVLKRTNHNTLVGLIQYANLTDLFTGNDTFTIFAPDDRAFTSDLRNLGLTMDDLKNNMTLLTEVLSYHVIMGTHPRSEMWNERLFHSLQGSILRTNHYVYNNGYYVGGIQISSQATQTSNALIHPVRHLLFPIKNNVYN